MTSPCEKLIRRDIARTYPEHDFFKEKDSLGQEVLFNVMKVTCPFVPEEAECVQITTRAVNNFITVNPQWMNVCLTHWNESYLLQAYSLVDREVGYCQGSAFIVGLLLMQVIILTTQTHWVNLLHQTDWQVCKAEEQIGALISSCRFTRCQKRRLSVCLWSWCKTTDCGSSSSPVWQSWDSACTSLSAWSRWNLVQSLKKVPDRHVLLKLSNFESLPSRSNSQSFTYTSRLRAFTPPCMPPPGSSPSSSPPSLCPSPQGSSISSCARSVQRSGGCISIYMYRNDIPYLYTSQSINRIHLCTSSR